ncbi:MAG: hypothetical protein KGV58_00460 [Campylobacteraceae bacterium]|nr:hypothetical protein [Campylobacteraceae bacterium]
MRYCSIVILSFLFFACSYKKDANFLNTHKISEQALINTRKYEIIKNNDSILFSVTYLNPIKYIDIDKNKEEFILNLHSNLKYDFLSYLKRISLNSKTKDLEVVAVDANSTLAHLSPTYTKWGNFFLIKAPLQKTSKLDLLIETRDGSLKLNFSKDLLK